MSAFKTTLTVALTALTIGTATLATASDAEARSRHHRNWAVGAAVLGGLAVGGLLASGGHGYAAPVYDDEAPVRRCMMVERFNAYGDVIGMRRVCRISY
ncbi:MAG: hypothetical protein ACRCWF_10885 [Beijerinckiaceae bacterium]